jgi:hypothetical protein
MLTIYLDGIELKGQRKKFVVNAMISLKHTFSHCHGSFVKFRRVLVYSDESPVIFFYWCASCGKINRISEQFPAEWYQHLTGKVISLPTQPVQGSLEYKTA